MKWLKEMVSYFKKKRFLKAQKKKEVQKLTQKEKDIKQFSYQEYREREKIHLLNYELEV